jgi:hypothetical protein
MNLMMRFHIFKGGVPILVQSIESPFEEPSSPHEEVPTTSLEPEVHLYDVIERIKKIRLDENSTQSHSTEQLIPFHKHPPKWLTKTLESVNPNEVGNIGTRISLRQDEGNEDNSNSGDVDDMGISSSALRGEMGASCSLVYYVWPLCGSRG